MRKLLLFTIGFAASCAFGAYVLSGGWLLLLALFLTFCCFVSLCFSSQKGKLVAMVLFGCVIGMLWQFGYDKCYLSAAKRNDGKELSVTITASDYNYSQQFGEVVDGHIQLDGKTYRVRTYLYSPKTVEPGDQIEGTFTLHYTGAESDNTYHQGKGIFLLAYEKEVSSFMKAETIKLRHYPAIWRQKILSLLADIFPDDCVGFAKALLLGETQDLTYAQNRAFQVSGIRHVVAVSGLHVAILFSLLYLFVGRNRFLIPLLGIPVLVIFAAVAGFTPSIVRACVMQALISLSMLTQREYDPPTALSFAVLVILAVNPMSVTAVGFQLSVGCMVGIFLFSEKLRQYFLSFGNLKDQAKGKSTRAKLIRWITGSVSVTLGSMVFTVPLCATYFGMVSLIGILTNILILWVISFVFYGIMLACLLGAVWLSAGKLIAGLVSWPIRYVFAVSRVLARLPLAAAYTDSVYIVVWLIFSYTLLIVFFSIKRKYPAIVTTAIVAGLCLCASLSWLEPRMHDFQVSVIDVGQGQSVLLQSEDEYYLVDCGSSDVDAAADTTANYLLSRGITKLDGLILTHYDADHAGGVLQLLYSVPAQTIYMPDIYDTNGLREMIERAYSEQIALLEHTQKINISGGEITCYPAKPTASDNESSMCVLFQRQNCAILITGDRSSAGERKLLEEAELPKVDILVVGHHGSHTATSHELLQATQPNIAIISVSEDNPYGHPHGEVLERLQMYGCQIYRTDQQGTITFRR